MNLREILCKLYSKPENQSGISIDIVIKDNEKVVHTEKATIYNMTIFPDRPIELVIKNNNFTTNRFNLINKK